MWGKLPFLAVFVSLLGVYGGNAFGWGYCEVNKYDPGNGDDNCIACPTSHPYSNGGWSQINNCYCKKDDGSSVCYGSGSCSSSNSNNSGGGAPYTGNGFLGHGPSGSGGSGGNGGNSGGLLPPGQSNNSGNSNFTGSCESGWWLAGPGYCTSCPRPTYFKESKQGASKPEDCYHTDGNSKTFYKTITCEPGTFMETGGTTCKDCFEAVGGFNKWCPGGDFSIFSATRLGVYDCPEGFTAMNHENATNLHDCFDHKFGLFDFDYDVHYSECSSGKWYDTQEGLCKSCPSGYNKSTKYTSIRPEDCYKSSNNEHFKGTCSVGYYLPKNKNIENGCTKCLGDYVCPGGTYTSFKQEDQGLYKCAAGYKKSGSACVVDNNYNPPVPPVDPGQPEPENPTNPNRLCVDGKYKDSQFGCIKCQAGFGHSDSDATTAYQCYDYDINGKKMYYKYVNGAGTSADPKPCDSTANCTECPEGKYVKAKTNWCSPCPSGKICRGGWFLPHMTADNGISDKDSHGCVAGMNGEYWDNTQGKCVECPWSEQFYYSTKESTSVNKCYALLGGTKKLYYKKVSCPAGKYLPKGNGYNNQNNSNGCVTCPGDDTVNYCPGVSNKYPNLSNNQGLVPCPNNQVPSSDHKTCQNSSGGGNGGDTPPSGSEFDCPAGTYLPAYGNGCQDCTNIHKYCPGGRCKVSSTDQCIYDCPPNAVASSNWKTCDVKLSQVKMKFGPNGTSTKLQDQCWLKTDIKDYVKCEFPDVAPSKKYSYKDDVLNTQVVQQEEDQR